MIVVCQSSWPLDILQTMPPEQSKAKMLTAEWSILQRKLELAEKIFSKLCEILNMPFSMSKDTWHSHEDALLQAHNTVVQEELEKNRREAKEVAMAEEGISDDNDVTVDIPISFDGTWSKRGYTANHGLGFVNSAATGKVLDYEIISKVCNTCTQKKASLSEQDFELWFEGHNCVGNFGGSSPSMEMECAKRLWARSQDSSLRYKYMISDGDSKSYSAIWNYYGAYM